MRKIEEQMKHAISEKIDFFKDNTQVTYNLNSNCSIVSLHGNEIAVYWHGKGLEVNKQTLSNWPTNTTKSRLRALGANVTTKRGVTYLDGVVV